MADMKVKGTDEAPTIVVVFTGWMAKFTEAEARDDVRAIRNLAHDGLSLLTMTGQPNDWENIRKLTPIRDAMIKEVRDSIMSEINSQHTRDTTLEKKNMSLMEDIIDEINRIWGRASKLIITSTFPKTVFKFLEVDRGAKNLVGFKPEDAVVYMEEEIGKLLVENGIFEGIDEEAIEEKEDEKFDISTCRWNA